MKIITDERCTGYSAPGHPERPSRISRTLEVLKEQSNLTFEWEIPKTPDEQQLSRAHTQEHIRNVGNPPSPFDADTPDYPGIYHHALRSVGGALQALEFALAGTKSFSLLRPPGHHATQDRAMGFCYFNSIAIACLEALHKDLGKIAVFDFDVHHGNGTEAILRGRPNTAFFSVHQHPCYPGTGQENIPPNCFNFPVPPHCPREEYRATLSQAWNDLLQWKPSLIAVSAGFDAYRFDPLAQGTLESEDYYWLGECLGKSSVPSFAVLEGGYSDDLPGLILSFLSGWER